MDERFEEGVAMVVASGATSAIDVMGALLDAGGATSLPRVRLSMCLGG
jgi:hypothetical protein